ncbi:thioredoxin domain-containing protein [Chlamydia gallinacea]|uniref:thioredoxin domain-containing protein n=1 Tax=Chlamydia gallinacea TaxID=1457153 RepID=UPI00098F1665|nr:thioredoxin domain-containing protein [Chlamydia gallinacea]AQT77454.1 thioredoxin domain-containing protein [Chlamydia gallinacea]
MSQPLYTNKLINEKSPYLLLYAHTPVNWYPWGSEAFDLAKSQDKPIFLSIGCAHSRGCRVMLQESFVNPEVAAMLNEYFVNVKIDKEELPHVAHLYFDLAQLLSVSGEGQSISSWPLNVFLTPDLLPFFSVNYLSAEEKLGMPSFSQMIEKLYAMWKDCEEREVLVRQAHKVMEIASFIEKCFKKELLEEQVLLQTVSAIYHDIDPHYGGIKSFPKTPPYLLIQFLLRYSIEYQDSRSLFFVDRSLQMMARGGIFDHLGGGFYCYTIDDKWLIPCFEKQLIDNAFLLLDYLDAGVCLKNPQYLEIAKQILHYMLSALYYPDVGAFYTSEHGESWGASGKCLAWSGEEIREILGERADLFCEYYGISREGFCNGKNILHIPDHINLEEIAEKYHCSVEEFFEILDCLKDKLRLHRETKLQLFKDDQCLAFHNGWMIHALVIAGRTLGENHYISIAMKCGEFIRNHLCVKTTLLRRWREGEAKYSAGLEDYGAVILGFLSLYEVGCGAKWLVYAEELMKEVLIFFRSESGGFYTTDGRDSYLLFQQESLSDGESISGSALICQTLIKLHMLTEKKHYLTYAEDTLQLAQARWHTHKFSSMGSLIAAQTYFSRNHKKILISLAHEEDRRIILSYFAGRFLPYVSLVWMKQGERELLERLLPEHEHSLIPKEGQKLSIVCVIEPEVGRKFSNLEDFYNYLKEYTL